MSRKTRRGQAVLQRKKEQLAEAFLRRVEAAARARYKDEGITVQAAAATTPGLHVFVLRSGEVNYAEVTETNGYRALEKLLAITAALGLAYVFSFGKNAYA